MYDYEQFLAEHDLHTPRGVGIMLAAARKLWLDDDIVDQDFDDLVRTGQLALVEMGS